MREFSEHGRIELQLNNESEFVYQFGLNRGHTLAFSKVNRCLFLSSEAKLLYICLCEYAYSGKRECYPSQVTLMLHLGWSRPTLTKYTNELCELGLISVRRDNVGENYVYQINDLHKVPALLHSELVYMALEPYKDRSDILEAVNAYKSSDVFAKCQVIPDRQAIEEWFRLFFDSEVGKEDRKQPEVQETKVSWISKFQPPPVGVRSEVNPDAVERKPKKRSVSFEEVDVADWNVHHFAAYFEKKYFETLRLPMLPVNLKEKAALSRVLETYADNKDLLKKKIDIYIESDFFNPKGVFNFCSNYVQSLIDNYLKTGTFVKGKQSMLTPRPDLEGDVEIEKLFSVNAGKLLRGGAT